MYKYTSKEYISKDENISIFKHIHSFDEDEHSHDFFEIEYVYCGSGYQTVNGISTFVERGDIFFFNFNDVHSYTPEGEIGIIDCLINPEFLGKELIHSENALDILALTSFREFNNIKVPIPKIKFLGKDLIEVEAIIEFMLEEFNHKEQGYRISLKGYLDVLLTKIFRAAKKSDKMHIYSDINKIAPGILQYIEENYNKKISLKELASYSFYNPSYFSRIFKECFGKNLTDYINERRIQAAMKLIRTTDSSIEQICYQVGFNDKKNFYRLFKLIAGTTPNTYRSLEKNQQTQ